MKKRLVALSEQMHAAGARPGDILIVRSDDAPPAAPAGVQVIHARADAVVLTSQDMHALGWVRVK